MKLSTNQQVVYDAMVNGATIVRSFYGRSINVELHVNGIATSKVNASTLEALLTRKLIVLNNISNSGWTKHTFKVVVK